MANWSNWPIGYSGHELGDSWYVRMPNSELHADNGNMSVGFHELVANQVQVIANVSVVRYANHGSICISIMAFNTTGMTALFPDGWWHTWQANNHHQDFTINLGAAAAGGGHIIYLLLHPTNRP